MRVVKRNSGRRGEMRAKRLDSVVEMKASVGGVSYVPWMMAVGKLSSVRKALGKMRGNHYSLMINLQLM